MNGSNEGVGPSYRESLVEVILRIRGFAERAQRGTGDVRRFDPHRGGEATSPAADGDAAPGRGTPAGFAGDGGSSLFTTRETDEGILVVGDLQGVAGTPRETEIDLRDDSLILTVDARRVSRVPIDDGGSTITDVSVNNGVLAVRVRVDE